MTVLGRRAAALSLLAALPVAAAAQSYPRRPIRMVLPFPAGSATDGATRHLAEELRRRLGQPLVIENQAGGNGIIATQTVRHAAADGYTFLVSTNSAHGVNPALYNQLPYDPRRDFDPVAGVITIPLMLLVRRDFPAGDVAGFVAVARERGATRSLAFGSGNTSSHVAAELLKASAGIEALHVPYRGTPQALQDLVGGQLDFLIVDPISAMGFVTSGKLRPLALTDTTRLPLLPELPTMAEAGHPSVRIITWAAIFAPAGTDPAIIERLNREANAVLTRPETVAHYARTGSAPMVMTPAELRDFVAAEIERWARLVELAGIPRI